MANRQVQILMGSESDAATMQKAVDVLQQLGVSYQMTVASAHRSPDRVRELIEKAPADGVKVFIVGAGAAAHLAGVVAAHSTLPVIGGADRLIAAQGLGCAVGHGPDAPRCSRGHRFGW